MADYDYDTFTFYGESNGCSLEQVKGSLAQAFKIIDAANNVNNDQAVRYRINYNEEKRRFYIRVVERADALGLMGKKEVSSKTTEEKSKFVAKCLGDDERWADIMEEAEEMERMVLVDFPLVFPGIVYLEGEDKERNWKKHVKPGEFAIMRARASKVFEGMLYYKLYLTFTGIMPSLEAIRTLATTYSTSSVPVVVKAVNKGYELTFDQGSRDGVFALLMLNGASLKSPKGEESVIKAFYARPQTGRRY